MQYTHETTFYRDKRVSDMTREELMDALVDLTRRVQGMHEQRVRRIRDFREICGLEEAG